MNAVVDEPLQFASVSTRVLGSTKHARDAKLTTSTLGIVARALHQRPTMTVTTPLNLPAIRAGMLKSLLDFFRRVLILGHVSLTLGR